MASHTNTAQATLSSPSDQMDTLTLPAKESESGVHLLCLYPDCCSSMLRSFEEFDEHYKRMHSPSPCSSLATRDSRVSGNLDPFMDSKPILESIQLVVSGLVPKLTETLKIEAIGQSSGKADSFNFPRVSCDYPRLQYTIAMASRRQSFLN